MADPAEDPNDVDDAASSDYTESSAYESEHAGLQYWIKDGALVGGD